MTHILYTAWINNCQKPPCGDIKQLHEFSTSTGIDKYRTQLMDTDEIIHFVNRLTLITQTMGDFPSSGRQKVLK